MKDNGQDKLRILLLCRTQQGIDSLLAQEGAKGYVSDVLLLSELAETGNLDLLNQSLNRLAPKAQSVNQADFQSWLQQSPLHSTALFVVALALHLSAGPVGASRFLPAAQLLQALLARERSRWSKAEEGQGLPYGTLADVVAFATLFDGLPVADVNTQLGSTYAWPADTLQKVHAGLADVWPLDTRTPKTYPAMVPDLLAAAFLWHWQNQANKQGLGQDAQLLAELAKRQSAGDAALLLPRWHMLAYDQTVRLGLGIPGDVPALASLLQTAAQRNLPFAQGLKHGFGYQSRWPALADLCVSVGIPVDSVSMDDATEFALVNHAGELNHHALNLVGAGDRMGALVPAKAAVDIYRRLAQANPAAYEADLANGLHNLAMNLGETGGHLSALTAANEAVDIRRRLAKSNPANYETALANSLDNLGCRLREAGNRAGALAAAEEAVYIHRRLAETNPIAYEPHKLVISISNLANHLRETGQRQAALGLAKEAVDIRRRLANTNPADHEYDLAICMYNLAIFHDESGDCQSALSIAKEAVDIRRRLAKVSPAAHEPDLARSLISLAIYLVKTGDGHSALAVAKEAVARSEEVNRQMSGMFGQQLAIARQVLNRLI